jgi:hypothetical protein
VAGDGGFSSVGDAGHSELTLGRDYAQAGLFGLLCGLVLVHIEDADSTEMARSLLHHAQKLRPMEQKFNALGSSGKLPCIQQVSCLGVPQPHCVVGTA